MHYTVNKLAKLSGVSVRTLHFYDEIGLLKPAYYGDNNYRYYEEEQLLMLQQILFYRELGFPLNEIQRIVNGNDFDKVEALNSHKLILKNDLDRTQALLKTIDKTILLLRGKTKMRNEELFYGFDSEKQKGYEKYLVDSGKVSQEVIDQSRKNVKHWKKEDWDKFKSDGDELHKEFVTAIEQKLSASSPEVQKLVERHYQAIKIFWTPTKESYVGLGQLYQTPEFRVFYDSRHPDLLVFMIEAMMIFAARELS